MAIITVNQVKRNLRIDHSDEDDYIEELTERATELVFRHIKAYTPASQTNPHRDIRTAAILVASRLYEFPDDLADAGFNKKPLESALSDTVKDYLEPFRLPTLQ